MEKEKNGKITLRLPIDIHERLSETAEQQNVSLNTLIISFLSENLGRLDAKRELEVSDGDK